MKSTIYLCFLILFYKCALSFKTSDYDSHQKLNDVYQIHWRIEQEANGNNNKSYIFLALEVNAKGWIGFGIADPAYGNMIGADILTATINSNGTVSIQDRYSTDFDLPSEDYCNDWRLLNSSIASNTSIIEVKRLLDTNDTRQDRPLLSGVTPIIISWSDNKTLNYHNSSKLATNVTFYTTQLINPITANVTFGSSYPTTYKCQDDDSQTTEGGTTESATTEGEEESPEEYKNDIGEVLGAGGVVALIVLGIGIGILVFVYVRKRQKEKAQRERAAALAAEMEMGENDPVRRSDSSVVKLDDSSMYYYSRDE